MTDYKTAYETLAAAAREAHAELGYAGGNAGRRRFARQILERALAQAPAAAGDFGDPRDRGAWEPTWHETCIGPILWDQMDADAAEREHCSRALNVACEGRPFYEWQVNLLIRERAAAARAATEVERERCRKLLLAAGPEWIHPEWFLRVLQRIAAGEKP